MREREAKSRCCQTYTDVNVVTKFQKLVQQTPFIIQTPITGKVQEHLQGTKSTRALHRQRDRHTAGVNLFQLPPNGSSEVHLMMGPLSIVAMQDCPVVPVRANL